jgi:hypothetical protein
MKDVGIVPTLQVLLFQQQRPSDTSRVAWLTLNLLLASLMVGALVGCGGGGSATTTTTTTTTTPLTVTLGASSVVVGQDGVAATVSLATLGPSGSPTVAFAGLPSGITVQYLSTSGMLQFTGSASAAAGTTSVTVSVSQGGQSASNTLSVISAPVVAISGTQDTSKGVNGKLIHAMGTSFQPAEWSNTFFNTNTSARETALGALGAKYIRIQAVSQGVPMKSNTGTSADWDFSIIDSVVQPALQQGSLEFQVAVAPAWMQTSSGHLDVDNHLNDFAAYAANLVRYYNKGGFDWGGKHFASPLGTSYPIRWWGIFNEFNYNGLTAAQYVKVYNALVPEMLAVDPTIKLSALELGNAPPGSGWSGDPELYLPTIFAPAASGGINAQVDAVSAHFYGTCNQSDSDQKLFAAVPVFAQGVSYFYQQMKQRSDLANTPVWVTENNVNADYANSQGMSSCTPTQTFVTDTRGTNAFFAAWRGYAFSQLAKVGNQALYHWDYDADAQYGEVNSGTGAPYLSYWIDQELAKMYPANAAAQQILKTTDTDDTEVESLATLNASSQVIVMLANHALVSTTDNNGTGADRTVIVDYTNANLAAVPATAGLLVYDSTTGTSAAPTATTVSYSTRIPVSLHGYGLTFLTVGP